MRGKIEPELDIAAQRRFVRLTLEGFAEAFGIRVLTLREGEHGSPESGWAICVPLPISAGVN